MAEEQKPQIAGDEQSAPAADQQTPDSAKTKTTPEAENSAAPVEKHHHHHHHHSGSHRSGSHHSKHRKRRSKRSSNSKDSPKLSRTDRRRLIWLLSSLTVIAAVLTAIYFIFEPRITFGGDNEDSAKVDPSLSSSIQLQMTLFTEEQVLIHPLAQEFSADFQLSKVGAFLQDHKGAERMDQAIPVKIGYEINRMPAGYSVMSAAIEVAENESFTDARVSVLKAGEKSASFGYLKVNAYYYYRITVQLSDGQKISTQGSFKTADTPRILSVEGIANVRDVGGAKTLDGRVIRQGLLFRGTELDGAVEAGYKISERGAYDMLTLLGIRTDMDLRSAQSNTGLAYPLGSNVKHTYYGASAYADIFTAEGKEATRKIFSDLADASSYPIYLHCTYGLDRTGTICYLLEGLLGVSEKDALRDYCLSLLYHRSATTQDISELSFRINQLEGATFAAKVEGYLLSIGVTADEIASIRAIFLDPVTP